MKQLDGNSIDQIVTDPDYGYDFMGKGKEWGGLPPVEHFIGMNRVLKPGRFAFIFSAPRIDVLSEMGYRLKKAGFITAFSPIVWTYATGLTKAMNISKYINKTPFTNRIKEFQGSYAGFQPSPAVEIVIVCMKPLEKKTYWEQALKNRKGITHLDDCRIPVDPKKDDLLRPTKRKERQMPTWREGSGFKAEGNLYSGANPKGRFPSNLLVSNNVLGKEFSRYNSLDLWYEHKILQNVKKLPKSVQKTFPFMIVQKAQKNEKWFWCKICKIAEHNNYEKNHNFHLFHCHTCNYEFGRKEKKTHKEHKTSSNIIYHITQKPRKIIAYLITLGSRPGDVVLDPYMGTGTTPEQSEQLRRRYIAFEIDPISFAIASARMQPTKQQKNLDFFFGGK